MGVRIHRENRLDKCLERMKRGDKKSVIAAQRAEALIKRLLQEELVFSEEARNRTKHGELRIDKCRKYDLGSGYRVVCVEHGSDLWIAYVGTHDDCDRWIENNRRFEPELDEPTKERVVTGDDSEGDVPSEPAPDEDTDYDEILMKQIDDALLREIFCGLCKGGGWADNRNP